MASSACNRVCAFALAALMLAGCAMVPAPEETAEKPEQPEQPEPGPAGLTESQRAAFERGASALETGNADLAVEIFERLTDANPELAAAHANLGTGLMMRGDDALARSAFERATALDATLVEAQVRLGVLYRRNGQFEKAEAAYKAALDENPEHRHAHLNLGILYDVYLQRPAQALSHYERFQALSDQPDKEVALWIADLKQRL